MSLEQQAVAPDLVRCRETIERLCSRLKRLGIEQDVTGTQASLSEVKRRYETYEEVIYEWLDSAEGNDNAAEVVREQAECRKLYLDSVKAANKMLKECGIATALAPPDAVEDPGVSASASLNSIGSDLANALTLPKVSVPAFSGNPAEYATFIRLFEEIIANKVPCDKAKLTYLSTLLKGEALQAVRPMLANFRSDSYSKAREVLYERYGENFLVTQSLLKSLSMGPRVTGSQGLRQLADELAEAKAVMGEVSPDANSQNFLGNVVKRCPTYVQRKWNNHALDIRDEFGWYPGFAQLVSFMRKVERRASDPVYGAVPEGHPGVRTNVVHAVNSENVVTDNSLRRCTACDQSHELLDCPTFKDFSVDQRHEHARRLHVCFRCLKPGHFIMKCRSDVNCNRQWCKSKHHSLLHRDYRNDGYGEGARRVGRANATITETGPQNLVKSSACRGSGKPRVYLPVVPVIVQGHKVNVLLDTGSTASLVSRELVTRLKLKGKPIVGDFETVNGLKRVNTESITLQVSPLSSSEQYLLDGLLVVSNIPAEAPSSELDLNRYPHLAGLPLPRYSGSVTVDMLVGMDHPELLQPLEVRGPPPGTRQPYASKTALGWTVQGPLDRGVENVITINALSTAEIEEDLQRLWSLERDGDEDVAPSLQDGQVLSQWSREMEFKDGHYIIPVPWKRGHPTFPNNRFMAEKRLESTLKKVTNNGQLAEYKAGMEEMLRQGYAERVPDLELKGNPGRVWYLPHHAVVHPVKKKLRIVFDCAATQGGSSLNGSCLSGPDLVTKLVSVLLRFRRYDVAVTADVKAMYMQVRLPAQDRDCLRFLWKSRDDEPVLEYRMCSHVFGGVWCASSSTFALRMVLESSKSGEASKEAVLESMYVDDLLASKPSVAEAQVLAQDTYAALQAGGFRLTKFSSNYPEVLAGIPSEDVLEQDKVIMDREVEKVLGLRWDVVRDSFCYESNIAISPRTTRRIILSNVASLYDPLGLVAPVVLGGKLLFQEATRLQLSWDDRVPEDLERRWISWVKSLMQLPDLVFPRCLLPGSFFGGQAELHHFGDGSLTAYGAVSYLRVVSPAGEVRVTLVMAKGRVAPMKATTVPRLEIAATVLAVNLDLVLRKELHLSLAQSTFWSDSQVALSYIASDSRRFKIFVANRVAFVRRHTEVSQWRYVPTKQNPADIVSRGASPLSLPEMWWKGPPFLSQPKSEWPGQDVSEELSSGDGEVKKSIVHATVARAKSNSVLKSLASHYSCLYDLCKALAWWRIYVRWLREKKLAIRVQVTADDIATSERSLVKWAQSEAFIEELTCLRSGRPVKASSSLSPLDPVLEEGILCVGGRLALSSLAAPAKRPWLLPSQHAFTNLVLHHYHDKGHLGVEWTAARLRCKYWILKVKALLKGIRKKCVTCNKLYSAPVSQKMADLPSDRCTLAGRAFETAGVDLFGPFLVRQGRSVVKRYGCIFTCTRVRAIHIEVLPTLEADSFLNGLVRFSARRGCPTKIISDNGTNFVGAIAELRREFANLDRQSVVRGARRQGVEWIFNPPHASHFGGVWERMVRTIRRVMCAVLNPVLAVSEEVLATVMCEAECMVNSRPLTKVSNDVEDLNPLTPNHFLMNGENFAWPWATVDSSIHTRRRWRQVQALMKMMWNRWLKEYLPLLQRRQKWRREERSLQVGDMVLVSGDAVPRGAWPLGKIVEVLPGKDGLVRCVRVKTRLGTYLRPAVRMVLLEVDSLRAL